MSAVLVVNPSELGELLATQFQQYGIEAKVATSAEDAIDVAVEDEPLAIVVDAELHADVDGLEFAELLRDDFHVPVILTYTGAQFTDIDRNTLQKRFEGLDAVFKKPFRSLALIEELARLMNITLPGPVLSRDGLDDEIAIEDDDVLELDIVGEDVLELDIVGEVALDATLEGQPHVDMGELDFDIDDVSFIAGDAEDRESAAAALDDAPDVVPESNNLAHDPAHIAQWWQRMKTRAQEGPRRPAKKPTNLEGELTPRALADVLDAFHASLSTGEIWLQHGKERRVILFVRGKIATARSSLPDEELAVIAVKAGAIDLALAKELATSVRDHTYPTFADALSGTGAIDEETLRALLEHRTRRIVVGAFSWSNGNFRVTYRGLGRRERVFLSLSAGEAIVRGILLTEHEDDLKKAAPADARFAPSPDAAYSLSDLVLSGREARIVVAMDGTKTMDDLRILFDDVPERILLGLAAGLYRIGVLRLAGRGPAAPRRISFF